MIHALDGNNNDQLVKIFNSNVESRKRSNNYKCPHCNKTAVANKGKIKQYFSHKGIKTEHNDCSVLQQQKDPQLYQAESIVHYLAKEVFKEQKSIFIPIYTIESQENYDLDNKLFPKLTYEFPEQYFIIIEDTIKVEEFNKLYKIKPDLNCLIEVNGEPIPLLIEIAVEHSCHNSPNKKEKIKNNNLNCIEIDLKNLHEKYYNIKKLVNSEIPIEEIAFLEEKIKQLIKDKLRYETINLNNYIIDKIKHGLQEQYKINLEKHNNNIIEKRKKTYTHALLNNELKYIDIKRTGHLYKCICCSNDLIIQNNNYTHENCSYLHGIGVKPKCYLTKYIFYKVVDDLRRKKQFKVPTLKSFFMSDFNLQLIGSFQHKMPFFTQEQYELLSVEVIEFPIILIKLKNINSNNLNLIFYLNFENEVSEPELKFIKEEYKNNYDYFIEIKITNYSTYCEDTYKVLGFTNWNIEISDKYKGYLESNYVQDYQQQEEKNKKQKIKNIEDHIEFVLDKNNKLIDKNNCNEEEIYRCPCCNKKLQMFNEIMHPNDTKCYIFKNSNGIKMYNYAIFYYQQLNNIASSSKMESIKFIFSKKDKFLLPADLDHIIIPEYLQYNNVIIESVDENAIEIDCIISVKCKIVNISFTIYLDLSENFLNENQDFCLDMVDGDNCYVNFTYENYNQQKNDCRKNQIHDGVSILNLKVLACENIKKLLLDEHFKTHINFLNKKQKDYENQKKLELYYKPQLYNRLNLYKRAKNIINMIKEKNINNLQKQLLIIKGKDLTKRNVVGNIYKKDLLRRLQIHKEKKSWNKKKIAYLEQQQIEAGLRSLCNKNKLINYKTWKALQAGTLILSNCGELNMLENPYIKVMRFENIDSFILNEEFLFKRVDKIEPLNFYNNLSPEDKKYHCIPFVNFNNTLFNDIIIYIDKENIEIFSHLEAYMKKKFIDKIFNPNQYFIDNIIDNNITDKELLFLNKKQSYININTKFLQNLDKILINLIISNEESHTNNIETLETIDSIIKKSAESNKIMNVIDYFSTKEIFTTVYNKYFKKHNLYSSANEQIKLLNLIKFKSDTIIEEFIVFCKNIKIRLEEKFLQNEYLAHNNKKALFLLSLSNDSINYINENDQILFEKMKLYELNAIKDIFKLSFRTLK